MNYVYLLTVFAILVAQLAGIRGSVIQRTIRGRITDH